MSVHTIDTSTEIIWDDGGLLSRYRYTWPREDLGNAPEWHMVPGNGRYVRQMPERLEDLAVDSRWPSFFPSPICFVTTSDGSQTALEKVVGASIVNRFPYVVALSFCRQELSSRHYVRSRFMEILESSGQAAIQFLHPGADIDRAMNAITTIPDDQTHHRIVQSGLTTRDGDSNAAPVFDAAYMVYEARLIAPGKDFEGRQIYPQPWLDLGSHRVFFLEINTIQLREDIAAGRSQIHWRSLPVWDPEQAVNLSFAGVDGRVQHDGYQKGYTPNYKFPSAGTVAFEFDRVVHGMAIKSLPPLPEDQVEVDNDRARWPCFFPSSAGLITTWSEDGVPNLMPCGSTTVLSRHPLIITPCVSYANINARYAPRASLHVIRKTGRFGCGVPYINDSILDAMRYAGNISFDSDRMKVYHTGLEIEQSEWSPVLSAVPIHFDCEVVGEVSLGTHTMFFGEVREIRVRQDVTPDNPISWCPWPTVIATDERK